MQRVIECMTELLSPGTDPLCDTARQLFGVSYLYPYQRLVIANTLDAALGNSEAASRQIVLLPTGAGKSLCFQLPAALLSGCTVVVYPLLSLIADQARRLQRTDIAYAALSGGTPQTERNRILNAIAGGRLRLLLTNPESLSSSKLLRVLEASEVPHVVIDEAHCVCEWGETFRPAYLELGRTVARIGPRVLTAFTATASAYVLSSVRKHLFRGQAAQLLSANPDRPNIRYYVVETASVSRALAELLGNGALGPTALGSLLPRLPLPRPAIVFCRSRAGTRLTAGRLRSVLNDDRIHFYHAGLSPAEKQAVENWFFASDGGILVATCAYGMGVDKKNVRSVIHPQAAPTVESFLQESGRAGRDGEPSISVTLRTPGSRTADAAESISPREPAAAAADKLRAARLDAMRRFVTTDGCRRRFLLHAMGAEQCECSGCDHCEATPQPALAPMATIQAAVRDMRRSLTRTQLARMLAGQLVSRDFGAGLLRSNHYASLHGWSVEQIEELTDAALHDGRLRIHRRGPWRNTIDSCRPRRHSS